MGVPVICTAGVSSTGLLLGVGPSHAQPLALQPPCACVLGTGPPGSEGCGSPPHPQHVTSQWKQTSARGCLLLRSLQVTWPGEVLRRLGFTREVACRDGLFL